MGFGGEPIALARPHPRADAGEAYQAGSVHLARLLGAEAEGASAGVKAVQLQADETRLAVDFGEFGEGERRAYQISATLAHQQKKMIGARARQSRGIARRILRERILRPRISRPRVSRESREREAPALFAPAWGMTVSFMAVSLTISLNERKCPSLPACAIHLGAGGEEGEAGLRQRHALLAGEDGVQFLFEGVKMQDIARRVESLRFGNMLGAQSDSCFCLEMSTPSMSRQMSLSPWRSV